MIDRTLAMLDAVPPGAFVPDDQLCYDPAEIEALGHALSRLTYGPSQIRQALQRMGVTIIPAGPSSPAPTVDELAESFAGPALPLDAVFDDAVLRDTLEWLTGFADEFDPPQASDDPARFAWANSPLGGADALAYYAFVRRHQPNAIVEIGSGVATLVALDAVGRSGLGRIVCVEPFPDAALRAVAGRVDLIEGHAAQMPPEFLNDTLQDGDFLCIQSSHAVKHGSDCVHLYLRLLPQLRRSVFVQVHGISLPDTLTHEDMRDRQLHWSEQYLLYAYLLGNARTQVLYGSHWHALHNREHLERFTNGKAPAGGGSLWFKQAAG